MKTPTRIFWITFVFLIFTLLINQTSDTFKVGTLPVFAYEELCKKPPEQRSWVEEFLAFFICPASTQIVPVNADDCSHGGNIILMDVDGRKQRSLTEKGGCRFPIFSLDGKKMAYIYESALWLMDTDGSSSPQSIFGGEEEPVQMVIAWSRERDGELAFLTGGKENAQFWSITLWDREPKPIDRETLIDPERGTLLTAWIDPRILPNGDEVLVSDGAVYIGKKGMLTEMTGTDGTAGETGFLSCDPSWSPDGKKIVFVSKRLVPSNIIILP